ncbi:MAG: hypothetical protein IKS11_09530, partial [Lachnospiraceae bacterium]|nr:hypothetical protein [Lachnospiraceae bacterium]
MKKMLKKVFAFVLAFALFASLGVVREAKADDHTAFLMFSDRNWAFGNWDANLASATTSVSLDGGTYKVTLNAAEVGGDGNTAAAGAMVFCVDIVGAQAALDATGETFSLTGLKVLADGQEFAIDQSKVVTGDIEGNGNFRIEIYNEYGSTVNDPAFEATSLSFKNTLEVEFSLAKTVKLSKTASTAFLMFSDRNWAFGNWDANLESATTVVDGAGTYKVVLNATEVGGDGTTPAAGAMVFCVDVVGGSNAMKEEGMKYELKGLKVLADGKEFPVDVTKVVTGDIEDNGNFRIEIYNEYGASVNDPGFVATDLSFANTLEVEFTLDVVVNSEPSTAFLMFTDRNWAFGNWDAELKSATTTVQGDGKYSVTLNAEEVGGDGTTPASGAMVFCVDIVGLANIADIENVKLSDLKILADGNEVQFDASKAVLGDIEENGNLRIELYNEYGKTVSDPGFDPTKLAFAKTLTVEFALSGIVYKAPEPAEPATSSAGPVDLDGTYNAYIGFQTPTYSFRNAFDDASYGRGILSADGVEYFMQVTGWDADNNAIKREGTFVDAVIAGNGTYTVKAEGLDLTGDFDSQDYMNLIFLSTDIPNTGEVTISNISLKVDGKTVELPDAAQELNAESVDYMNVQLQSKWSKTGLAEIGAYHVPMTSMEITFTVSG